MTAIEKRCKKLCREIVMADDRCEMCGERVLYLDQHHGLFRSSQRLKLNRGLLYQPELQFCLCTWCHLHRLDAPHVDNEVFLVAMKAKGDYRAYKAYAVEAANEGPLVIVPDREINYNDILAELLGERKCQQK